MDWTSLLDGADAGRQRQRGENTNLTEDRVGSGDVLCYVDRLGIGVGVGVGNQWERVSARPIVHQSSRGRSWQGRELHVFRKSPTPIHRY